MTEDNRVARNPGEPDKHAPAGAQRWIGYLDWVRAEIAEAVLALDADAQRRTAVPSGWTPIELLSHVLHMEQRWFVWGFLGERGRRRRGATGRSTSPGTTDADGRWHVRGRRDRRGPGPAAATPWPRARARC